jgi:hypothetical protein
MVDALTTSNNALSSRLGVFVQAGVGQAYPDLVQIVRDIYRKRVAKLAFIPAYWLGDVLAAMEGGDLVLPTPTGFKSLAYPIPDWLSKDQAALSAWRQVYDLVREAQSRYIAGRIEEGRYLMAQAEANAAFWDGLYTAAVAIRDAPGNAVDAIGKGTVSALGSFLGKSWWVLALVGIGLLAWYGRGTLGRMAVRKLAGSP